MTVSFALAALALTTFTRVAVANPVVDTTPPTIVHASSQAVTVGAHFPVRDLGTVAAQANVTLSAAGAAPVDVADAEFPATLILCPAADCASCFGFNLSTLPINECLVDLSSNFISVGIEQPSNEGLSFAVLVGPPGCTTWLQIPMVNECYNIIGGPYQDFAVFD